MIDWSKKITVEVKEAQQAKADRSAFKSQRAEIVRSITVTTTAGHTFDGDEQSQNRMMRAIIAAQDDSETIDWTLADNSVVAVNRVELSEALRLAGLEQSAAWQPSV